MIIEEIIKRADKLVDYKSFKKARTLYEKALQELPKPREENELYLEIMAAIADTLIDECKNGEALKFYDKIMKHPEAESNAYLHLRRGQLAYSKRQFELAEVELVKALEIGGEEIFEDELEEYYEFALEMRDK